MASIRRRSGYWHIGYSELGKWAVVSTRIRAITPTPPPEVLAIRNEIERRVAAARYGVPSQTSKSVAMATKEWMDSCPVRSTRAMRSRAARSLTHLYTKNVSEISKADGENWIASLKDENYARSTAKLYVNLLRHWWKFCAKRGWCDAALNPFSQDSVSIPKGPRRPKRALTSEEQTRILSHLRGKPLTASMIGLYSGCRISECLAIRPEDVDFDKNVMMVTDAKSKKRIAKPLHPKLAEYLKSIPKEDWPMGLKMGRAYHNFKQAAKAAGVPEASPHFLRHTLASELLHAGVDIRAAAAIVGHSVLVHQQVYAHADAQRLADALNKAYSS